MTGLAQPIVRPGENPNRTTVPSNVYGLVVSRSFPDLDFVAETVTRLQTESSQESPGGSVWACAETDTVARSLLPDPVLLPLVPSWRLTDPLTGKVSQDLRRIWRDCELLLLCSRVYVFQKAGAETQWTAWRDRGVYDGLTLIEGPAPPKRSRGTRQGDSGNNPSLRQ